MSGDDSDQATRGVKKPRLQNACDQCRRRKIRCDSGKRIGNYCTNCLAFRLDCTHVLATAKKKRGPPKGTPKGHRTVQSIVASILSSTKPYVVPDDPSVVLRILTDLANHIQTLEDELVGYRKQQYWSSGSLGLMDDMSASIPPGSYVDIDSAALEGLSDDMKRLSVIQANTRHFGNSSSIMLVKTAMDIKKEYHEEQGLPPPVSAAGVPVGIKREEFWTIHPWQKPPSDPCPPYSFPPADLLHQFIALFFTECNKFLPILYRPSFERSVAEGLHYRNRHFGALVLAVCAVGARLSDDPRVLDVDVDGQGEERESSRSKFSQHSAGWQWIKQIRLMSNTFTEPPSLYQVQMYGIYVMFMYATSTPEVCWVLVSLGVRYAQDVGAHRKRSDSRKPTVEGESWKRVVWMLYVLDIFCSAFLGRPRALSTEDFDVEYPIDCDDEYWEHPDPEQAFKQPAGRPSAISYWITFLKLADILGFAQRTLFSVRRRENKAGADVSGLKWNEKIVTELDSSLNKWIDSIPEHLKWDPDRKNIDHLRQSTMLYVTYYWVQIQIHRPFIAVPGRESVLSFPSLAICANAARSCCHVVEVLQRRAFFITPNVLMALFNAAIMLLLNVWRGARLKPYADIDNAYTDVYKCMNMIKAYEHKYQVAGRFWDILCEVISVTHKHHDQSIAASSLKRNRDANDYSSASVSLTENINKDENEQRMIAGSQRVSLALDRRRGLSGAPSTSGASSDGPADTASGSEQMLFTLPVHSDELGSLPVHTSFDWLDSVGATVPDGPGTQFTQRQPIFGPEQDSWSYTQLQPHSQAPVQRANLNTLNAASVPLERTQSQALFMLDSFTRTQAGDYYLRDDTSRAQHDSTLGAVPTHPERFLAAGLHTALGTGGLNVPTLYGDTQTTTDPVMMNIGSPATHDSDWNDWGTYIASVDEVLRAMDMNPTGF